jgi:hypothetical protein
MVTQFLTEKNTFLSIILEYSHIRIAGSNHACRVDVCSCLSRPISKEPYTKKIRYIMPLNLPVEWVGQDWRKCVFQRENNFTALLQNFILND